MYTLSKPAPFSKIFSSGSRFWNIYISSIIDIYLLIFILNIKQKV